MSRPRTVRIVYLGLLVVTVVGTVAASCWAFWPRWQESRQVAELIDKLGAEDGQGRINAMRALHRIGAPVIPQLIKALSHPIFHVRYGAAIALGRIGPGDGNVVPALVRAFKDENQFVRGWAIRSVGWMDEDGASATSDLTDALNDNEYFIRKQAAVALSRIGPEAIPPLVDALSGNEAGVRAAAASALGEFGTEAQPAIPALVAALRDDDLAVRSAAVVALGRIGPEAKAAVPALVAIRKAKGTDARYMLPSSATSALMKIDPVTLAQIVDVERKAAMEHNVNLADGLYFAKLPQQAVESMKVIGANDKPIEISLAKGPDAKRSSVYSVSNQNDAYIVSVEPDDVSQDSSPRLVLCVGKECLTWASSGGSNGKIQVAYRANRQQADKAAAFLKVPRNDRQHPGHKLQAEFTPAKNSFKRGEDIVVTMKLTNVGDVPITYAKGGEYHSEIPRCNRFAFVISYDGKVRKDIGSSDNGGGMFSPRMLKPGESDSVEENLLNWGTFSRPGKYQVHCRYRLDLTIPPPGESRRVPDYSVNTHLKWDDSAEQVIDIVVE